MPQTEEEHLENQNLDNDDSDRSQPDAEVCTKVQMLTKTRLFFSFSNTFFYIYINFCGISKRKNCIYRKGIKVSIILLLSTL